jgi:hypothetical protein
MPRGARLDAPVLGEVIDQLGLLAGLTFLPPITRLEPGAGAAIPFAVLPASDPPPRTHENKRLTGSGDMCTVYV